MCVAGVRLASALECSHGVEVHKGLGRVRRKHTDLKAHGGPAGVTTTRDTHCASPWHSFTLSVGWIILADCDVEAKGWLCHHKADLRPVEYWVGHVEQRAVRIDLRTIIRVRLLSVAGIFCRPRRSRRLPPGVPHSHGWQCHREGTDRAVGVPNPDPNRILGGRLPVLQETPGGHQRVGASQTSFHHSTDVRAHAMQCRRQRWLPVWASGRRGCRSGP